MVATDLLQGTKDLVTVEIGDKHYKCVHFKMTKNKKEIISAKARYEHDLSDEQIVTGIKDFMTEQKIKDADVVNVIPSKYGIYKNIEIPSIDEKEIKQIIDLQAGAHTPYPKNEIVVDYTDIGRMHDRYTKVLLVIVKRESVSKNYDLIKRAGFKANTAVLAPELASKLFSERCPQQSDKPLGLVHTDVTSTDFTVVKNNKSMYIRSINIGARDLESNPEENKKLFIEELKKSVESYQASDIDEMPERIYFTGATKQVSGMLENAKEATGAEVEVMPYSDLLKVPKSVSEITNTDAEISLFSTIAPFLLEDADRMDLIPEDIKEKLEIKKKSKHLTLLGIYSIVLFILLCSTVITDIYFKKEYLEKLRKSYRKENQEVQDLNFISERIGDVKRFMNQKGASLFVLTELYKAIPEKVFLSSMKFNNDGTLVFTGTAETMSMVFSLVTELENNKVFKNVKVDFTKTRRQKGEEVADFGLTMSIESEGNNA